MDLTAVTADEGSITPREELIRGDKGKDNVNSLSFFMSSVLEDEQSALKVQLLNNQVPQSALDQCLLHGFQMLLREIEKSFERERITHVIPVLILLLKFGAKWNSKTLKTPHINQVTLYHIICQWPGDQHEILELMIKANGGILLDAKHSARITPLLYAVARGNLKCVETLIRNGADINLPRDTTISPELTPLINAILGMYEPMADIALSDSDHERFATRRGIFDFLLESGADIHKPDCGGCTPLMYAASKGSVECIVKLLQKGARLDVTDRDGQYVWKYAIELANVDPFKRQFYQQLKCPPIQSVDVLKYLSDRSVDVLKCLYDHGVDKDATDAHGRSILYFAVSSGKVSLIRYILSQGVTMIANNPTSFDVYCESDSNNDPCIKAIQLKRLDLVQMLDECNCQTLKTLSALRTAVVKTCESVIEYLLSKHKYPLNEIYAIRTSSGAEIYTTVLAEACTHCSMEVVEMLLDRGADPNIRKDKETYCSPLHRAIINKPVRLVAKLISSGADINAKSFDDHFGTLLPYEACIMHRKMSAATLIFKSGCFFNVHTLNMHLKGVRTPLRHVIEKKIKNWNLPDNSIRSLYQICRTVILKQLSPATSKKIRKLPLPFATMKYLGIPELDDFLSPC